MGNWDKSSLVELRKVSGIIVAALDKKSIHDKIMASPLVPFCRGDLP